jgi:exodeoxyribonuclease-3
MLTIATWNVNSIRVRMPRLTEWLAEASPDIALLQEIKVAEDAFPREPLEELGYNLAICGQKTYNGVAILSKRPIEDVTTRLPGDDGDDHARYIEAFTAGVRVASLYVPNGNPWPSDKFDYKLAWLDRLYDHAARLLKLDETFVLGGDYNVCPTDDDVYDPAGWVNDALCRIESRSRFRALLNLGLVDAFRALHVEPHAYSFWDYTGGAWQKGFGLRIDHLLLSPQATDRLVSSGIDRKPRGRDKPSDHTPVVCRLADEIPGPQLCGCGPVV